MIARRLLFTTCLALATLTGVACQSQKPMASKDAAVTSSQSQKPMASMGVDVTSSQSCTSKTSHTKAAATKATDAKTLANEIQASKTSDVATPIQGPLPADLVLANTVCPVSGETLDRNDKSMHAIIYKGKVYGVCCSDCLAQAQQNPSKFLATTDKAK